MAKGDLIRAIMRMKHSPAGKEYLAKKKKKKATYSTLANQGIEKRLRAAGLTEKEIARLHGKGK
jgi:NAD-dependent SIR2 family protein deacetylase